MRRRGQKYGFLPVYFLQLQVRRQQVSVRDLSLLQQLLHRKLRRAIGGDSVHGSIFDLHDQPVSLRSQPESRYFPVLAARDLPFRPSSSSAQLFKNFTSAAAKQILEYIYSMTTQ